MHSINGLVSVFVLQFMCDVRWKRHFSKLIKNSFKSWASLEHEIKYKHHVANPERISKELKRCADQLASCDVQMQTIRQLVQEGEEDK